MPQSYAASYDEYQSTCWKLALHLLATHLHLHTIQLGGHMRSAAPHTLQFPRNGT